MVMKVTVMVSKCFGANGNSSDQKIVEMAKHGIYFTKEFLWQGSSKISNKRLALLRWAVVAAEPHIGAGSKSTVWARRIRSKKTNRLEYETAAVYLKRNQKSRKEGLARESHIPTAVL